MSKSKKQALISQVQETPELVVNVKNEIWTNSLIISEKLDKRHDHVIRDIEEFIEKTASTSHSPNLGAGVNTPIFIKTTYKAEEGGREYPMYLISEKGVMKLIFRYRGDKAEELQDAMIDAFAKMRAEIAEMKAKRAAELATISANKANPIWLPARVNSISDFHILADVIKNELIPLAKLQKSSNPDKLYQVYMKMIKAAARVKDIKNRDLLSFEQLNLISYLEITAAARISELVKAGIYYKNIYLKVKQLIEKIANSKFNNQPFEQSVF